jgi:hypothetical protein
VKPLCRRKELQHKGITTRNYYKLTLPEFLAMLAALQRRAAAQRTEIERRQHPLSADLKVQRSRFFPFPSSGIERSPKLPSGRDSVEGTAIFTAEKFRLSAELRL